MAVPAFFCAKSAAPADLAGIPGSGTPSRPRLGPSLGQFAGRGYRDAARPPGAVQALQTVPLHRLADYCGADGLRRGVCPTWTPARSGTGWSSNPRVFYPGFSADWGCNFSVFHLAVYCAPACCISWVKKYFAAVSIGKGGPLRSQEGTKVPP